jgi:1-deoxy-D-xylulose-5-phosphate reductoisomerase
VEVVVHPQSTIHSFVEFIDGSILAQFSVTDMRLPILYALTYPERIQSDMRFPVGNLRHLDFCPPDMSKFPCLRLAYEAAEAGGARTVALNAADEVAVAAFLAGDIGFNEIPRIVEDAVSASNSGELRSIAQVLEADADARRYAQELVSGMAKKTVGSRATYVV